MTQFPEATSSHLVYLPKQLPRQQQKKLLGAFWVISLGLITYELFWTQTGSLLSNLGAILITIAALLPSYLWCSGRVQGLPIFPFFAVVFIWSYGLPLVSNFQKITEYSPYSHLFAGQTVAGFLTLGTFIWFHFVKLNPQHPKYYRILSSQIGNQFFLIILLLSIFFNAANAGGWLKFLDAGLFSIVSGVTIALSALSAFVLAYRLGCFELSKSQGRLFIVLLLAYMLTNAISLLLVSGTATFVTATAAFIIARKKIPVLPVVIVLVFISFLHYGKGEMRSKYWFSEYKAYVQPWEYPNFYTEWISHSIDILNRRDTLPKSKQGESFIERSSIIQMLMLVQDKSPNTKPFLYGKTYEILPQLLIPRILNNNKIRSAEGTHILSIHYGLQTYKDTLTTSISWGLLAESYANFGLFGCGGLAVFVGSFFGAMTRWSINAPVLSAQFLLAVLMMTFALQNEWTAGVYLVSMLQSCVLLFVISLFLMRTYRVH